jgi:hypothetical protein
MVSEFCNRFEKLIKSLEGNEYWSFFKKVNKLV